MRKKCLLKNCENRALGKLKFCTYHHHNNRIEVRDVCYMQVFHKDTEYITKFDIEDLNKVKPNKWCVTMHRGKPYVVSSKDRITKKFVHLQNFIMKTSKGFDTDHISGNTLDNCRNNLRICSHSQNLMNQSKHKTNNTSGFKGVSWHKEKENIRLRYNFKKTY